MTLNIVDVITIEQNQPNWSKRRTIEENTPEWLTWRRQGITSNDVMVLLSRLKHKTRQQLWEEKTGAVPPPITSPAYLKKASSPPALDADREGIERFGLLTDKGGKWLFPVGVESAEYPMMRAVLASLRYDGW